MNVPQLGSILPQDSEVVQGVLPMLDRTVVPMPNHIFQCQVQKFHRSLFTRKSRARFDDVVGKIDKLKDFQRTILISH
jgi:hypothetical protein